jgi:hypothetical protein
MFFSRKLIIQICVVGIFSSFVQATQFDGDDPELLADIVRIQKAQEVDPATTTKFYTDETPINDDVLMVAVFMIKNEAHAMPSTLKPYIDGGVKNFFIYDTGSTDETIAVVKDCFSQGGIKNYFIAQEVWVEDFSRSRNRGLALAREKFPKATFLLNPDAEWGIHNVPGLLEFCNQKVDDLTHFSYLVRIMNNTQDFKTARLIRARSRAQFLGDPHETIVPADIVSVPMDVYFELGGSEKGVESSRRRWKHSDLPKLLLKHRAEPTNPRWAFYLAQTYDCLGDAINAYKYYEVRLGLNAVGSHEENWLTAYRLAQTAEVLGETDPKFSWPVVLDLYLRAYTMRQIRCEPLVKIGEHYWKEGNRELAFFFGRRAAEIPYPADDNLSIDKHLYEFQRYELVSKSAFWVQECALGERATSILLKKYPRKFPQLHKNMAVYLECNQRPTSLWGYQADEDELRDGGKI